MKILVIAPAWIGDAVAAQPLFMRLHEKHPGLQLDVLAPPYVAPLLGRMPQVQHVISNPFAHGELNLSGRWRLGRQLANSSYDQAIVLPNSWKSALLPFFSGIKTRIGFIGEARYGLLNVAHKLDTQSLPKISERYAQLAETPGTPLPRPLPQPRLEAPAVAHHATLESLNLVVVSDPVILCPGAEYGPAKRWPSAYFAELAQGLHALGRAVWLIGSPKDQEVCAEISAAAPHCVNLCGKTTLEQAIDLIAGAAFVVTNDSGLMHVAAALDRPMLALYGSSSPKFTPPLSARAEILSLQLECSPCFKRECPLGHFKCMKDMLPQQVLARVSARLVQS